MPPKGLIESRHISNHMHCLFKVSICPFTSCPVHISRASDFFQDWWAEVTHGAKNGGSFSEMMGPSVSNQPELTFG